jgi:hypothetical protein
MKQVMMYVSDEFHEMLATHMIRSEALMQGVDFYFDSFRTEALYSDAEGEEIPVLACNAAFRSMMVSKGHSATLHIKQADEERAALRASMQDRAERIAQAQGWSFCEGAGLALRNINGEIVPCNEETRRILRTTTVSELLGMGRRGLTQQDYSEVEECFELREDKKTP